jgi:hypothetical protein
MKNATSTKAITAFPFGATATILIFALGGCGPPPSPELVHLKSISVRGVTVAVGDPAENALKAFAPANEDKSRGAERSTFFDPDRPGNIDELTTITYIVGTKHYLIDYGLLDNSDRFRVKDIIFLIDSPYDSVPDNASPEGSANGTALDRKPSVTELLSLDDFEKSPFCKTIPNCRLHSRYMLEDGTTNSAYFTSVAEARAEVQSSGWSVYSIAISFYDLDSMRPKDLSLINSLVCSVDKHVDCSSAMSFIRKHITDQPGWTQGIRDLKPAALHGLSIRAGTVGSQQIVVVSR